MILSAVTDYPTTTGLNNRGLVCQLSKEVQRKLILEVVHWLSDAIKNLDSFHPLLCHPKVLAFNFSFVAQHQ